MSVLLRNDKVVQIRSLEQEDLARLHNYLQLLSLESRSRFGPHSFDRPTLNAIFDHTGSTIQRYVAIDVTENNIVAYMLICQGMIEAGQQRFSGRNQYFDPVTTVTFAP